MNYREAMEYLVNLTTFGFNFGLDRIKYLLEQFDNPQDKIKTVHIGGTNGKGSTSAMLSAMLQKAGCRVGVFTSPHLHSYRERVVINDEQIPEERVAELLTRLKAVLDRMVKEGHEHPTEFEVNTALAFIYFFEEKVDLAVIEVGLGGLIDSTNVITPLVSVITNVGMDHMDYLGQTLPEIAAIKAGIIKDKGLVVTAATRPEVLAVIEKVCKEKSARLVKVQDGYSWQSIESSPLGQRFNLSGPQRVYADLHLKLLGEHQMVNAATAVAVAEALNSYCDIRLDPVHIRQGLAEVSWPGRLELVRPGVLLDGAHNLDGAETLAKALQNVFNYRQLILCIGMLADKERSKVLALLGPLANKIVVTKPNNPRAGNWQEMAGQAKSYVDEVYLREEIPEAVDWAVELAGEGDLVCITGSLYMISEARAYLLDL